MIADFNILAPFIAISAGLRIALVWMTGVFNTVPVLAAIGGFGIAIIILTLLLRTLVFPFFRAQIRTSRQMQRQQIILGPQMAELRKKYRTDFRAYQTAVAELQKEHGMNPGSSMLGCLMGFLPIAITYPLFYAIKDAGGQINAPHFLWIPNAAQAVKDAVGGKAFAELLTGFASHPQLLIFPLLAAGATFIQSRMMMPPPMKHQPAQIQSMNDFSRKMTLLIPVSVFIAGVSLPQGLALYWVSQSLYMIVQQYYLIGWGSLHVPTWFPGHGRITPLTLPTAPESPPAGTGKGSAAKTKQRPEPKPISASGTGVAAPVPPSTKRATVPSGSPSRLDKGSGRRRKRR